MNGLTPHAVADVPLYSLLDEDVLAMLAGQVELRNLAPRQRIYKIGEPGTRHPTSHLDEISRL